MEQVKLKKDLTDLTQYKEYLVEVIDERTSANIMAGFTFDGNLFSMSMSAQINLSNIFNIPDGLFPLPYSTKTETVYNLTLENRQNFYLSALGHKNTKIQEGTTLKQQVLASTTIDELDTIKNGL